MKKIYNRFLTLNIIIFLIFTSTYVTSSTTFASEIRLNRSKLTLQIGESTKLKIVGTKNPVSWTSSNSLIANVSTNGNVYAKKSGTTTIIATINHKKVKCNVTVKKANGQKTNPYSAFSKRNIYYQNYIFLKSQQINLVLEQIITGDSAYTIIKNENMYNKQPTKDSHWILMQFHLKYVKGSSKQTLSASDVFQNFKCFYEPSGKKRVKIVEFACFSKLRKGKDIYDVVLKEGEESDIWIGILVDKSIDYPIYRIPVKKEKYLWFITNPIVR
jgi:hypothetical protein